jgi:putative NIF3 family GTP cyclohydrolase 1 type 2/GNAT superfamily N-acetyltransferase
MTLTASQVHAHFRSVGTWVDWDAHTTDGFKFGNPDIEVKGIAVGWQSVQSALEEAHAKGCNLFITHEPTFYAHMDDNEALKASEPGRSKVAFLERTGMVVYRCHDVWDVFPRLGIVDAWSAFLELGEPINKVRYYNLHALPPVAAWELVMSIAQRITPLGEQAVEFFGTRWKVVHKLAVGTGAITDVRRMVELGADVVLTTDDGASVWRDGSWIRDMGIPMIRVNHAVAEIPGMRKLADYLRAQFPGVPVEFIGPTCPYEVYATERWRDVGIRMRRDELSDLPPVTLPEGYTCRPMRANETWAYMEVMQKSHPSEVGGQAWFDRTFTADKEYDPSYLMIIWKGEIPVAVTGAWHGEVEGERWGVIHWVGVSNTERNLGLGKAVTLAAMHRLRERGFERATLVTQPWRLPAIATYLRLGFRPWPNDKAPQELWDRVLADLETFRQENRRQAS